MTSYECLGEARVLRRVLVGRPGRKRCCEEEGKKERGVVGNVCIEEFEEVVTRKGGKMKR